MQTMSCESLSTEALRDYVLQILAVMRTYLDDIVPDDWTVNWSREDLEYHVVNYGSHLLNINFID